MASFGVRPRRRMVAIAPDAIALLKADHKKIQVLFDQFEKARSDSLKLALARQISMELRVHTIIEEEIFYPIARKLINDNELLDEAAVEHQFAKALIAQIDEGLPSDAMWSARVVVLGKYVRNHFKEEQSSLFSAVRDSSVDLRSLGQRLLIRKQVLTKAFKEKMNGGQGRVTLQFGVIAGKSYYAEESNRL